ncbi:MAG TPA: ABC transporter permease [Gemmatimonadaceae bacterium]|nr:ABC transporter permease [Gemmatimonadaceae bacterium]
MSQFLDQLGRDARHGIRALLRNRTFTVITTLTLALGVALNTTVFSVVNAVLLRPLPYAKPGELVAIGSLPPNGELGQVSPAELFDYRRESKTTTEIAFTQTFNANVTGGDRPDRADATAVTANFFTLLGVPPLLGRTFLPSDQRAGFTEIAVISYGLWQRAFGGTRDAIGKTMRLDDDDYVIVGIMPPGFTHPALRPGAPIEIWLPAGFVGEPWPTTPPRSQRFGEVIARLKPGVTVAAAQRDFDRINASLVATYPDDYGAAGAAATGWRIGLRPVPQLMIGNSAQSLRLLLGAVGFVLLIACTNVSSLAVARGAARRGEIAVRAALGAVPRRLARGLLVEHLMLAAFAGVVAVLISIAGVSAARALAPESLPRREEIAVDWRVLLFALGATMVAGLLVGALPAIGGARTGLSEVMKAGGRASTGGPASRRARAALIALELALSVVLLAGAGLVARSFWSLQQVSLGFQPANLALAELTVSLPNDRTRGKYVDAAARAQFFDQILKRLATIPGVQLAAGTRTVPLRDASLETPISVDGRPPLAPTDMPRAALRPVSSDYFAAMGMPLVRGRGFTDQDRQGAPPVAVISETMAERLFGKQDPIGQRIKRGPAANPAPWVTIVGVVSDARLRSIDEPPGSELYVSMLQAPPVTMAVVLRTRQDPATLGSAVVRTVREIDPDQPVYHTQTMNDVVSASMGQRRFAALLLVVFAVFSLGLAAVGVYGLVAQSVAQRRRELGLRMAIGASPGSVLGMVVRESMTLAAGGILVGLALAFALTRLLQGQLFAVSARDPLVFGLIGPVLLVVVAAASWMPARVASRTDPMTALQPE